MCYIHTIPWYVSNDTFFPLMSTALREYNCPPSATFKAQSNNAVTRKNFIASRRYKNTLWPMNNSQTTHAQIRGVSVYYNKPKRVGGMKKRKTHQSKCDGLPPRVVTAHREAGGLPVARLVLLVLLVAMVAGFIYLAAPGKYTGPRHKKKTAREQFEPLFPSNEGGKEEGHEYEGYEDSSINCKTLMSEAKKLVETRPKTEWEAALDKLALCALQEPSNHVPRWNLAAILLQMGRTEEAVEFMDEALRLDPYNLEYLKASGLLLSQSGLHSRVVLCLEAYLEVALRVPSWEKLLASISVQREDEWEFIFEAGEDVIRILEVLQAAYLQEVLLIKAGYLYKVIIGLKGEEVEMDLLSSYAFFSFGLGDFATGIKHLRQFTERQYMQEGYGNLDQADEVVTAHSLRLFTAGFDTQVAGIAKNLLSGGDTVWEELEYNCKLGPHDAINYTTCVYQSDLRHLFIKCVMQQNIVEHLLDKGAVVYAENRFGWTPLLHAVSIGSLAMVRSLLKKNADPLSRTVLAHTSLHVAAMRGTFNVIPPLIKAGLKTSEVDYFNRTPLQVACLHRWSAEGMARALGQRLPENCPQEALYHPPPRLSTYGGWLSNSFALPQDLTSERCDFDVLSTSDVQTFVFNYLTLQRPVLVRNATSVHVMKRLHQLWQRNKFVNEYGNLVFKEVKLPYVESSSSSTTSLRDFLGRMKQFHEYTHLSIDTVTNPSTIFETIPHDSPLLKEFSSPAVLDENITHISPLKFQFYVGPPLSGVPIHFHRSSWDVLIYGQKRWFLYPPDRAFYSKEHVLEWWRDSYQESPDALECVQYPGDLVFIPDMWGNGFINLREGVGIASEFIYGASEFSI